MHDDHRSTCSPVAELLQKLVEDIIIVLHECDVVGEEILEQPHPLKETNKFVDTSVMVKSTHRISGSHNTLG